MSCSPSLHDIPFPLGLFYFCGLIVTDFLPIGKTWFYTEISLFYLLNTVILTGLPKGFFFSQSPLFHNLFTVPSLKASRNLFFSNSRPPTNFPISSSQNINSPFLPLSHVRKFPIFPSFLRSIFNFFIIQKIYLSFRNAIPTQSFSKKPPKPHRKSFFSSKNHFTPHFPKSIQLFVYSLSRQLFRTTRFFPQLNPFHLL